MDPGSLFPRPEPVAPTGLRLWILRRFGARSDSDLPKSFIVYLFGTNPYDRRSRSRENSVLRFVDGAVRWILADRGLRLHFRSSV